MNRQKITRLVVGAMVAVAVLVLSAPPAQAGIGFRLTIGSSLLRSSGGHGSRTYQRYGGRGLHRAPVYRSYRGYGRTYGCRTTRHVTASSPRLRRYGTVHQRSRVYLLRNVVVVVVYR